MSERITSLRNDRIKGLIRLIEKSRKRRDSGLFVIEGVREFRLALEGGYIVDSVFVCPSLSGSGACGGLLRDIRPEICFEVSEAVFSRLAFREGSDGLIASAWMKSHSLNDLTLSGNPFIIVLESLEKPGNLGAILRTAAAAGVDAIIVCDPLTDVYNLNVIRSSVGCIFSVPLAVASSREAFAFLRRWDIRIFAAELNASSMYYDTDFTGPCAIVMGTEADGLSAFWLSVSDGRIKIPMCGKIDSLNVSVSTAVITYEAVRQRRRD
ncbi:MAG: RNA methyltransferase [Dysgonamonadaceae bacterium]|nr:RNA methyltransferase [Dysgonamonadaceae bacterium]